MTKETLDEIMKLEPNLSMVHGNSLRLMAKFVQVSLESDQEHNIFYQVKTKDVLESAISDAEMINLVMEGGWQYSPSHENVVLYLK